MFEGNHFRNGFMYKQFGMNAIVRKENIRPSLSLPPFLSLSLSRFLKESSQR